MRKIITKIDKNKKKKLEQTIFSLTQKCVKRPVTPLTESYVAQCSQQTPIAPTYKPVDISS